MSGCEELSSFKQHEKRTQTTRHETARPVALHSLRYENQRQCTYNITIRRIRVTIVAVEKQ